MLRVMAMWRATRVGDRPSVGPDTPGWSPEAVGTNINGPSLIRVPDWVEQPLGRYYLYFAHHKGRSIRLAVADQLAGPWRIHEPGVLGLEVTPFEHHIASPDVHVDVERRRIVMYYHGHPPRKGGPEALPRRWEQATTVAVSRDALAFESGDELLAESYLRVFEYGGMWYGLAKRGMLFRSPDPLTGWESLRGIMLDISGRHWAVHREGDVLHVFYSRWGDAPERILQARVTLGDDPSQWRLTDRTELLRPERTWEGADLPVQISLVGAVHKPVHELRDPAFFRDDDGRCYLVYSGAGEACLGLAELERDEDTFRS